jgi:hypothetical protein
MGIDGNGSGADNGDVDGNGKEAGAAIPDGVQLGREEDGPLVLELPISRERFVNVFLPFFGLAFIGAGIMVFIKDGDAVGFVPLGIGLVIGGFGWYLARGRLEIRLGADRLEWTRLFLRRWKTHVVERGQIASLGTQAGVRTNGRPTSWRLHYVLAEAPGVPVSEWRRRRLLPGFHPEASILWLGGVLEKWAQAPFDRTLDRSVAND